MAVLEVNFVSSTLGRTVPMNVILPTDKMYFPWMKKREEGKPYKTLYLLHGIIGNYTDWLYGTRIQRWAEEHDLAVVMPSGDNAFYVDQPWNCNFYGEFIGKEIVEFTRKSFPLSHKKEDTYIGGLSMGGFGALRNGLKYSDTFGAIVSLSGAFILDETILEHVENPKFPSDSDEFKHSCFGPDLEAALCSDLNPEFLIKELAEAGKEFPDIFMACGDRDPLLEKNQRVAALLEKYNVTHVFEVGPGSHEWDFWDTYLKKAIDWLPLEGKELGVSSGNVGL